MQEIINQAIEELALKKDVFEKASQLQLDVWNEKEGSRPCLLLKCDLTGHQDSLLPAFNTKQTHYDSEKMLVSGLRDALTAANGGREAVPSVRANMGTGIFPSLLGVMPLLFDDKMPWVKEHISKEQLSKMSVEDIKICDEFKYGLEHMAYMAEKLQGSGCMIFPMDLQGPFDTAHIVYGDNIFYDLYDDPAFMHHLLELCCHAIIIGMEECLRIMPDSANRIAHYNSLVMPRAKGGLKISEDTSTLVSKAHIEEFVAPYTHKVLEHFGGGYIHYCGKNPHLFDMVMNEPLAFGLNFGNPEKHDMLDVLAKCKEKGKVYYGRLDRNENESLDEYFSKYINASTKDGKSYLLLDYYCSLEERPAVVEAWDKAVRNIYRA